ncbi:glycosyltransferase family 39 protein [Synechococcus sp. PCC 7336]|uniref:glycosyltransferase family 39 protein n=1 Tax=Synechococcus sp. PCC 7336 TaxID=195250 RepID=UPI00034A005C|nr:glycosyltransferase family 39 protein [Synechococcus sp. PCC 7336]
MIQMQPDTSKAALPPLQYRTLLLLLLLFGVATRLAHYFSNRSLWLDEASLAISIVDRSYPDLLTRLEYDQSAPPLFLWIEKLAIQLFGNHEYALRFFPLLSGLAALLLFYKLARRYATSLAVPIAIALFASLKYLVFYAAETKPYSTDMALALLLFLLLVPHRDRPLPKRQILTYGLLGAVSIWLSFPIVFVLAGIEIVGFLARPRKLKAILLNRWPMYLTWSVSFISLYRFFIIPATSSQSLSNWWAFSYPDSPFDWVWGFDTLGQFFYRPLGFLNFTDGVAIFAFVCGCIALYRQDKWKLAVLIAPLLVTLTAAYLHQYPFHGRLVLFLAPFALIAIAEGAAALLSQLQARSRKAKAIGLFGAIVSIMLVLPPLLYSGQRLLNPSLYHFDHLRPAVHYIQARRQPVDTIHIFPRAHRPFLYYARQLGLSPADYSLGRVNAPNADELAGELGDRYRQDIAQFRDRDRVWFLIARKSEATQAALLAELDRFGSRRDAFAQPDVLACLYDFSSPAR